MENQKFYQKSWLIRLMLIFIAPIGIILVRLNKRYSKRLKVILSLVFSLLFVLLANGCKSEEQKPIVRSSQIDVSKSLSKKAINHASVDQNEARNYTAANQNEGELDKKAITEESKINDPQLDKSKSIKVVNNTETKKTTKKQEITTVKTITQENFVGYRQIEVDGGNLSGHREQNVVVDIGYGDRTYYAYTNGHGQLVKVTAKKITLQDDSKEKVLATGRYYADEAKVPGVESQTLDEGHVIADSLGGVSNAYNITPQNSTLNRHGDQAYMEKVIRGAGGCTDFEAIITYKNTSTQIPSHYSYTYTLKGNVVKDSFDNVDPDEVNKKINGRLVSSDVKKR